jgi:PKD repeat protein
VMGGSATDGLKNDVWRLTTSGSSAQNPSHTYTTAGIYSVALQAYNAGGYNKTQKAGYISVTGSPHSIANFTADGTEGTAPFTLQFTDTSTGSPTSWNWSFGDGNFSDIQSPVHTYESPGVFTVSLKTSYSGSSDVKTRTDYITVRGSPPSVTGIFPTTGGNTTSSMIMNLTGSHFSSGATVIATPEIPFVVKKSTRHIDNPVSQVKDMYISDTKAYFVISGSDDNLRIFDISDPVNQVYIGDTASGPDRRHIQNPSSVFVSGSNAYVTNSGNNELEIMDVSDPANPVHKGNISDGEGGAHLADPNSVFVSGTHAYVASTGSNALEIVDISDPANPVHKSSVSDGDGGAVLVHPMKVVVASHYAYVLCPEINTLDIIDISDPAYPEFKGSISDGTGGALLNNPSGVHVSGIYAYVTSVGSNALEIVDVSDPANPVHKGSISDGAGGALLSNPLRVYVFGNDAYVTSYDSRAIEIVDVSDPSNPVHKGSITGEPFTRHYFYPSYYISVSGSNVYFLYNFEGGNFGIGDTGAIPATNVSVDSEDHITCEVNLTGKAAGLYDLIVTNPDGQLSRLTNSFLINAVFVEPVADFSADVTTGTAPLTVSFTDSSSGAISTYAWDFGDGGTSNEQNPSHQYYIAGSYTVNLTVIGPGGSAEESKSAYITVDAPNVAPVLNPANGHYYDIISGQNGITWSQAKIAGQSLTYKGLTGHLVTITSAEENDFVVSNYAGYFGSNNYFLGGYQPSGSPEPSSGWQWVTGEPWSYTNWEPDSPGNHYGGDDGVHPYGYPEDALETYTADGKWNDYPSEASEWGRAGYIVEWDPSAPAPVAGFSGTPTSGTAPLAVDFTDESTGSPTGWAWYFGDETYGEPWSLVKATAEWTARSSHSSVVMLDGSIILMGGEDGSGLKNDVWRSTDNGSTWTLVNATPGWTARSSHSSVVMPDGSIILMGGEDSSGRKNDVWTSTDSGTTWIQLPDGGWSPRNSHSSVVMPDGTIVLMGGFDSGNAWKNDVWQSTDYGVSWIEVNPSAGWTGRVGQSTVVTPDGSIVLAGGSDNGGNTRRNDTWLSTDHGESWTEVNPSAEWSIRSDLSSVSMPDGSIVIMGGFNDDDGWMNDVWRSTDKGSTWMRVNENAAWTVRDSQTSVVIPDGTIVLMGGYVGGDLLNDVWRLNPVGSSVQNPSHNYIQPGTYSVTLQAYNAGGYNRTQKAGFVTVTGGTSSPTLNSITPSAGFNTGSVSITEIKGSGLSSVSAVKLTRAGEADILATNIVPSPTTITCNFDLTEATPGAWTVVVTNAGGTGTLPDGFTVEAPLPPTVSYITPASGVNTGLVSITDLAGTGFDASSTVKLSRSGGGEISATNSVTTPTTITCDFDLTSAATGAWDVVVTNAVGTETLAGGFTVTAEPPVIPGTVIERGATVFIGEEGLDITHALNSAQGTPSEGIPPLATIGFWVSDIHSTPPIMVKDLSETYKNFFVDPAVFGGYDGTWYVVGTDGFAVEPAVFESQHPTLDLAVVDTSNNPVNGMSVPPGTRLKFRIQTNMAPAVNPSFRSPVSSADGYIDIRVQDPDGGIYSNLLNDNVGASGAGPNSLSANFVDTSAWDWGAGSYSWQTAALDSGASPVYPRGTYVIWAESTLHGMRDNYLSGGAAYSGRTVSPLQTFALNKVDFTADASSGLDVAFTGSSTTPPASWEWDFGDGGTSAVQNPSHQYSASGTYWVNLTATYAGDSDRVTKQIAVMETTQDEAQAIVEEELPALGSDQTLDFSPNPLPPVTDAEQWGGKPPVESPEEVTYLGVFDTCERCNGDHDYIYYYVNESGEIVKNVTAQTPPTNIDFTQVKGNIVDPDSDLNSISSVSANPGGGLGALNLYGVCSGSDCKNNYALLISGGYTASDNHIRYWNDISFMYQTLNQTYGYPKDHITVLMSDGNNAAKDRHNATSATGVILTDSSPVDLDSDGVAEITATSSATKSNLITTLATLNSKLTPADSLFIFTTSHGGNDTVPGVNNTILYLWNSEFISDTEFVGKLPATPGNITMVMEQCNGGGFIDNFTTRYNGNQKRVIATAAKGDEPSRGNGFSNAWMKGVAMINEQRAPAREADASPYGNNDGKISMLEAFKYALATDPSALSSLPQHEHPQYETKKLTDNGATRYLFGSTCTAPVSLRVGVPNTAETWYMGYTRNITWTQTGIAGNVDIELWNKTPLTRALVITTTAPASKGYYTWTLPRSLKASTTPDYLIKISSNATRTRNDTSNAAFSIKTYGAQGTLKVNSIPSGAMIYLDGYQRSGTNSLTNATFAADPGSHTVTVKLNGYLDQSAGLLLSPSQSYPVTFKLDLIGSGNSPEDYGTLSVTSMPWEAEVFIDEVSTGQTTTAEIPVLPGTHNVTVKGYGYEIPDPQQVTIDKGEIISVDFGELTPGSNVPPLVDAGSDATIDGSGTPFESSGFFRDSGEGPWTANVSYGDGSGVQTLDLNDDKTFALSHSYSTNGDFTVRVEVNDGILSGVDTATVTITNLNNAPVLDPIGPKSVSEGQELRFTASSSDPDGNALTNTTGALPAGAAFDEGTGTFTWTPEYDQAGSYQVNFTVSDGLLTDFEEITITVTDFNRPPVLDAIGPKSATEGQELRFTVSSSDPDGNALINTTSALPAGAAFDVVTGTFTWTPGDNQAQATPYPVTFTVSDGTLTDFEEVAITVIESNRPPVLATIGAQSVNDGTNLEFTISASDADNDPLTYAASTDDVLPTGVTFDPGTRTFSWTPTLAQVRTEPYLINFTVSDGHATDFENVAITVTHGNRAPVLAPIGPQTVSAGTNLEFTISATDADNDPLTYAASAEVLPTGVTFDPLSRIFSWTPTLAQVQADPYLITFNVSDGRATDSEDVEITVKSGILAPVANFTAAPLSGTGPLTVAFTDTSTNTPTSWTWSYRNGTVWKQFATTKNPSFTFAAGTYDINLTATNAAGSDTKTINGYITVSSTAIKPVVNFTATPLSGTGPLTVAFTDTSTNTPTSWTWSYRNGTVWRQFATTKTPSFTFAAGTYDIRLTATNAAGSDTKTINRYITVTLVREKPVVNFTATPLSGTGPLTVAFTDTSTNTPTSWTWSYRNGAVWRQFATTQNPSFTFTAGTYDIRLTATNAAGSNTKTVNRYITVTLVREKPVANFTATPLSGTGPLTVAFTDTSTNSPTSWKWSYRNGTVWRQFAITQNPAFTFAAGTYDISLTATNAIGSNTKTINGYIMVSSAGVKPVADFTATPLSGTGPLTVAFTDTSTNSPTSWTWSYRNGTVWRQFAITQNPAFTFAAGAYDINLTATNAAGSDTKTRTGYITVTVSGSNAPPVLGEIMVPGDPIRIGNTIQVSSTLTDPDILDTFKARWEWDDKSNTLLNLPAGTTTVTGSHTYTSPDVFRINLTVSDSGGLSAYKEAQSYVVVYDPSAGYVIGAGAIDSPAGAYLPNTSLKGTGYFGFVSKYRQGISRPQGVTEFYYDLGSMNFYSDSYDWLVVTGARASFKGSGKINGKGDYGFLLTATDGALLPRTATDKSDKFRIRIWNKTPLKRVYDNMLDAPDDADPTTKIKSGFIIIQK